MRGGSECQPRCVHLKGDNVRVHGMGKLGCRETNWPLPEDGDRVADRHVEATERGVGGSGIARNRSSRLKREFIRQRYQVYSPEL
jgi:hypothetical protein